MVRQFAVVLFASFLVAAAARTARSGEFLPQSGCDTLSIAGQTIYDFHVWNHNAPTLCKVELRPIDYYNLARAPILSWEMPDGWTAEWIPNEPGAIVVHGCVSAWREMGPVLKITMPGRVGTLASRFFDENGNVYTERVHWFWCGPSPPVPATGASWGSIKSLYR